MQSRVRTRPGIAAVLCTGMLLAATGCGPTAQQLQAREASASPGPSTAAPSGPPPFRASSPTATATTASPTTSATAPPPPRVGVTGHQVGMPQTVQDACQWLLRRDALPMPGREAGACVSAAMAAGTGGVQTLQTETSWLPAGTYTVEFRTAPDFAMILQDAEQGLTVSIRDGRRILRINRAEVAADPNGSAEEASAAVLADAAELTVRPERLAALLAAADTTEVDYGADGAEATRISGSFDTGHGTADDAGNNADDAGENAVDGGGSSGSSAVPPAGSFTLTLDSYYRPVRIEITGLTQGITSTITAVNAQWGTRPLS